MSSKRVLETDLVRALIANASLTLRDVRLFRRNVGLVKLQDRVFRAGVPGQCDIYCIGRGGWHGEVECKRYGKLSAEQVYWRDWCRAWGIPWMLLEAHKGELPVATVDRWLAELRAWLPSGLVDGAAGATGRAPTAASE
jgi:hypothetical protein